MNLLKSYVTSFFPKTPLVMVYMLQQVEYDASKFFSWVKRLPDYRRVVKRKKLVITKKSLSLVMMIYIWWTFNLAIGLYALLNQENLLGLLLLLSVPVTSWFLLYIASLVGSLIILTTRKKTYEKASLIMEKHKGVKIAVLGSYGKTTMKELLYTVLSQSKNVAVTPGNMNVAISHARWITSKIRGDEDFVIFEYGEFKPGDIKKLAELTSPDIAIICGIAPNHLENYKSYNDLKADIASISEFVNKENLYVEKSTASEIGLKDQQYQAIEHNNVLGWKVSNQKVDINGVKFTLSKSKTKLKLSSGLIGDHLTISIAFAAAFAGKQGLSNAEITNGVASTNPFEHRMQPYQINGAWVIDDTYNGNLEGMKAGLKLLSQLKADRKIYVTPGLVEQGEKTVDVHIELGKSISRANPDKVVLMNNSVQPIITKTLEETGFRGDLQIVDDPLDYYTNIQYQLASGDLVLMQNDWTDNYN